MEQHLHAPSSELEFFRMTSKVIAMIREGHTDISPSISLIERRKEQHLFPFDVWLMDDRLVVRAARDPLYEALIGAEITQINHRPVRSLLHEMGLSIPGNSGKNNYQTLKATLSLYNNFAQAYYYYIDTSSTFLLEYQREGSHTITQVNGVVSATNGDVYPKLPAEQDVPIITELHQEDNYALIKITTFAWWTGSFSIKAYKKAFKAFFKEVEVLGISNLIVDVRNNRGGEELIGLDLLSYLIPYAFQPYDSIRTRAINFSSLESLPDFEGRLKFKSTEFEPTDDGYYKKNDPILEKVKPKTKHFFNGSVYVLGNGRSWSAASTFLTWTKTHSAGTFIGQEGGGAFDMVDGRYKVRFTLPYSGLHVSYPVWSMMLNAKNGDPTRGAMPDIVIEGTPEQLLNGTDAVLEYTLRKIEATKGIKP